MRQRRLGSSGVISPSKRFPLVLSLISSVRIAASLEHSTEIFVTIKESADQLDWKSLGLDDLKGLGADKRLPSIQQEPAAATLEDAVAVLIRKFGFDGDESSVTMTTPVGDIQVCRDSLPHIVEKRPDARERYVNHAIATLCDPFEIWEVAYTDGSFRHAFIGTFEERNMMLVVATITPERILWNFMHSEAKSMNKHRHGKLVYARHAVTSTTNKKRQP